MNNPFIQRQMELRQRMISSFSGILVSSDEVQKGEDDLELEKAHKDGDMHPNGKWVWVSSANGGKGDWRTINGRTHKKHTAAQGGSGSSGSQGTDGGNNVTPKAEKPGQQASKVKVDTTTIDDAEYKRMYAQAKSVDDESRSIGLGIINSHVSKYKKDLEDTIAKRPGAKATIKQLQDKLTKFVSQKKAAEDVIAELEKNSNSGGKLSAAEQKALDNVVDKGFKISRSSWNDVSKMSLEKTPKGNWRCYYDGKDTGNTIAGSLMSEATAKKLGMLKDDATQGSKSALDKPSGTSSSSTDPKKKKVINTTAGRKYQMTVGQLDDLLEGAETKDDGGTTKYHVAYSALGEDRGTIWQTRSQIESYLRQYNDAQVSLPKSSTAKTATTAKTDDLSSTKINLSVKDFHKKEIEDEYGDFKNAPLKLHEYSGKSVEYYDENGKKQKATPYISEFYASNKKQDKVGGYEIHFDRPMAIGVFKTLNEAINALNDWMNKMRVPGHGAPKWIHNRMKGEYQMNFSL